MTTGPRAGEADDQEEGQDEGPQPWVAADNGGSDIPVAVGIFVATVVGTPVKGDMDNIYVFGYYCQALVLIPIISPPESKPLVTHPDPNLGDGG